MSVNEAFEQFSGSEPSSGLSVTPAGDTGASDIDEASCKAAGRAAERVIREECDGTRVQTTTVTEETTIFIPEDAPASGFDPGPDGPDEDRLAALLDDDEWIEGWAGQMCAIAGILRDHPERERCLKRFVHALVE